MVHDEKGAIAIILGKMKPKGEEMPGKPEHGGGAKGSGHAMLACAEDLMESIKAGDAQGVASALMSAFHVADAMPHVEGVHEDIGEEEEGEEY
jgi:hypothetical protein